MILSEQSDKVVPALVTALAAMTDVATNKKVNAGQMRYAYADLGAVLEAVKPHLAANGLAVSQWADVDGVSTVVFHESGQWVRYPALHIGAAGTNAQAVGSAISYSRRYQILSVFGLATEDDDGRSAMPAAPKKAAAKKAGLLPQVRNLQIAFTEAGVKDRGDRLNYVIDVIGRPVESSKELSNDEIDRVLKALSSTS